MGGGCNKHLHNSLLAESGHSGNSSDVDLELDGDSIEADDGDPAGCPSPRGLSKLMSEAAELLLVEKRFFIVVERLDMCSSLL